MFAALSVLGASGAATAAPIVTLDPFPTTVTVGSTFNIQLNASGFTNGGAPSIEVFNLTLTFGIGGPIIATGVSFGTALGGGGTGSTQSSSLGVSAVGISEGSLLAGAVLDATQPASFLLATISFQAINPGTTFWGFKKSKNPVRFTSGSVLGISGLPVSGVTTTTVNALSVPEPESFLLLLTGLAILAGFFHMSRVKRFKSKLLAQVVG